MASILGVETLQHTNGTTAATIDSSGNVKPTASGSVVAVRFYSNNTRSTVSSAADGTLISFTDTKLYGSETNIIVTANVIGHGQDAGSGITGAYISYDGTEKYGIDNNYNALAYNNTMTGQAKFTGVSSGNRTVKVGWNTKSGVSALPFPVLNPNSTDDSRGQQSESTIIVYEVIA